jgi:hypothetical protein
MRDSFGVAERNDYDSKTVEDYRKQKSDRESHTPFDWNEDLFDDIVEFEKAVNDSFPKAELRLTGFYWNQDNRGPIVDGIVIFYDEVEDEEEFEDWCKLRFKNWFKKEDAPEEAELNFEGFRQDNELWLSPDEFHLNETDNGRKYCSLWWD